MALKSVFDSSVIRAEFDKAGINNRFIPLIWKYVIQNPDCNWEDIPSLPSSAYTLLRAKFKASTSVVHSVFESNDGVTTKLLIKLQNGAFVESVIMRYDSSLGKLNGKPRPGGPRSTLCVSSQVGCKMGCTFCATGTMGFKNNLSSGEIVEQLVHASHLSTIRNIVFMGMGEPLNNYSSLVDAIRVMTASPFQISPRKITVSTVGIIHAINKLHNDIPNLNLAVSLHAPVQDIRCQIMPAARAFPLEKLMNALQEYQKKSQQKIFIEYIMLDGLNDEEQHAHQLGKLLEAFQVVVNLIPFNPIGSLSQFITSTNQKVARFQKILRDIYDIRTTVRKEMGQDISGACGQLVVNLPDKRSISNAAPLTDIEDIRRQILC
uniref:Radical SAM core domain-containing protein n=2 Tax=Solanum lycopersicum TaxID=4081 RepID=A0A3Q7ES05_SOLLC